MRGVICLQANQIPVSKTRGLSLGSGSVSLQWLDRADSGLLTCSVFSLAEGRLEVTTHHLTVFSAPVISRHSGTGRRITANYLSPPSRLIFYHSPLPLTSHHHWRQWCSLDVIFPLTRADVTRQK